jgi:sialate O-acetylesterase
MTRRLLCVLFWATCPLIADVKLAAMFTDGMVVQRGMGVAVWGTAGEGEDVTVNFRGRAVKTKAAGGRWRVRIDAGAAGGPFELVVNGLRVRNVLVGEVWLAGGQSKMQYTLGRPNIPEDVLDAAKQMARDASGAIRYFSVRPRGSDQPLDDVIGTWKVASPENITDCSAVAWYFVVALQKKLNIPIGLIISSVGNTPAEAWLSQPVFEATSVSATIWKRHRDELAKVAPDAADRYKREMEVWTRQNPTPAIQFANARSHPAPPYTATDNHVPCRFYNGMIHGLAPYTLRGIIWYQADGNLAHPEEYPELIKSLIRSWRKHWHAELPFYYVEMNNRGDLQTQPVEEGGMALLREMQATALELPKTGYVCAVDLVRPGDDVHFPIKQPVGDRLAGVVLSDVYQLPVGLVRGPEYAGHRVKGDEVILQFRYAEGLRVRGDGEAKGFVVRGADGKWVWASARIEGEQIRVWNRDVPHPLAVRYAWASNPILSVENQSGLPLQPFRTDRPR